MTNLDYYRGRDVKVAVEATGRRPTSQDFLVAAVLCAGEETWSIEQLVKMLYEINSFVPQPVDRDKNMKELGF
jgi:hypothetical protein